MSSASYDNLDNYNFDDPAQEFKKIANKRQKESKLTHSKRFSANEPLQAIKRKEPTSDSDQDLGSSLSQPISKNIKKKHKKKHLTSDLQSENEGTKVIEQRRIKMLFRNLCDPDGKITMQSLGRSMVHFTGSCQLDDIKKMIQFYYQMKNIPIEEDEAQSSNPNDQQSNKINTKIFLDQKMFEQLFKLVMKKQRKIGKKSSIKQ